MKETTETYTDRVQRLTIEFLNACDACGPAEARHRDAERVLAQERLRLSDANAAKDKARIALIEAIK